MGDKNSNRVGLSNAFRRTGLLLGLVFALAFICFPTFSGLDDNNSSSTAAAVAGGGGNRRVDPSPSSSRATYLRPSSPEVQQEAAVAAAKAPAAVVFESFEELSEEFAEAETQAVDDEESEDDDEATVVEEEKEEEEEEEEEEKMTVSVVSSDAAATVDAVVPPHAGYKKVLLTGAAGFIGSHTAEHLLARGDDVVIIDEMNDYYDVRIKESNLRLLREKYPDEARLKIYRGDICDEELLEKIFQEEKPEWVCHLAARAGVRPSIQDPYVYIHSNVEGTTRLMDLAVKYQVKNFVYASSSSVYGGSNETYFSESQSVDHPVSPYAASKKSCELLAYTWHSLYGLPTSGLRFFTVYGPRGRPDMAPFKFIDRISRGVGIEQYGDGSSSRDYTYVDDIVDGVVRSLDRPYGYQIFNLGRGDGTNLKDFIGLVEQHTGRSANIKVLPFQAGDVPYTRADVSKARRLLGYDPQVPFEEGIRRTVEWYNGFYGGRQHNQLDNNNNNKINEEAAAAAKPEVRRQ